MIEQLRANRRQYAFENVEGCGGVWMRTMSEGKGTHGRQIHIKAAGLTPRRGHTWTLGPGATALCGYKNADPSGGERVAPSRPSQVCARCAIAFMALPS